MVGSRNSGKTTLMGYLFYALANIDKGEIERWKSSDIMVSTVRTFVRHMSFFVYYTTVWRSVTF